MNRRGFLGSILVAAAAPAIVRAGSLMKIARPTERIITPASIGWLSGVREMSAYDITKDVTIMRFDVAGYVGGVLQQFTVSLEDYDHTAPLLVSRTDSPIAIAWPRDEPREVFAMRDAGILALKKKIDESGMHVSHDILRLPEGVRGRFLA